MVYENGYSYHITKFMKSLTTLVVVFWGLFISLSAQQNVEFTKANMAKDKDLRKVYKSYVKKGDVYYYEYERGFLLALEYYLLAYEKHPNSAMLNYKIANCYLNTLYKYKALPHALKAMELDSNCMYNMKYIMGQSYQQHRDFDKAIGYYKRFKNEYSGKEND